MNLGMWFKWNVIKLFVLILVITGLYAFSNYRGTQKKVKGVNILFEGDENLYITEGAVNKLLIQNYGSLLNLTKDKVALNTIEKAIEANEMVKNAQVFLTIDGGLTARIVQRKPIGRIEGNTKSYLDDDGKQMPLSKNHSARVPIITGKITGKSLEDVYEILKYINEDEFLRKNVIGIHVREEDDYQLKFRVENFVVNLGGIEDMEEKFTNFKAFYAKANKDRTLDKFAIVSLEFDNQVVCTKI